MNVKSDLPLSALFEIEEWAMRRTLERIFPRKESPLFVVCEVMPGKYHVRLVGPEGRDRPNQRALCGKETSNDTWLPFAGWGQTEIPGTWCPACWRKFKEGM